MQIRRFYLPEIPDAGLQVTLPADEARHAAKVLRLGEGDSLVLLDGAGTRARAVVTEAGGGRRADVVCRVVSREELPAPSRRIRLYVAPPRGKTMNLVLRSAAELGVWRITPILCQYGVAKPDQDKASWHAELVAAVKQSGNAFLPVLDSPVPFSEALAAAEEPGAFGAVPRPGANAAVCLPGSGDLGLWIGPEGGFSDGEEDKLYARAFVPVTVGRWVLRVETAVPALLGRILGDTDVEGTLA